MFGISFAINPDEVISFKRVSKYHLEITYNNQSAVFMHTPNDVIDYAIIKGIVKDWELGHKWKIDQCYDENNKE